MNNSFSSNFEQDDFKEYLTKYEEMINNQQSAYFDADQLSDIAEYYASINNYKQAFGAIEYALKLHPGTTEIQTLKGHMLLEQGKIEEAENILESLSGNLDYETRILKARIFAAKGLISKAEQELLQIEAESKKENYENCLDAAYVYSDEGYYKEALPWFEKALQLDRDDDEIIKDYSECCIQAEQYDQAIKLYNNLLDQDPYSYNYWFALGKVYYTSQDYHKALEAYDFVLTINPEHQGTVLMKAHCFFKLENYEEAANFYQQYAEIDKESEMSLFFAGLCYYKLEKIELALDVFLKSLARETTFSTELVESYNYVANCYFKLGNTNKALEFIDLAIKTDSKDTESYIDKGEFLFSQSKIEEAEEAFNKAIQLESESPEDPSIFIDIATIYFQYHLLDKAEKTFKLLETVHPDFDSICIYLSYIYLLKEDKENFNHYFKEAVNLYPESINYFLDNFPIDKRLAELIRKLKKAFEQDISETKY